MIVKAYDFETTGVNARECEPVSVAIVEVKISDDGSYEVLSEEHEILEIEADEVPAGAFGVHGICKSKTIEFGRDPHAICANITGTVLGYNNNSYDNVIAARYGAEIEQSIDLIAATRRLKKDGVLEKATLTCAYETLVGESAKNAHDALADVHLTLALIKPIMAHYQFESFPELVDFLNTGKGDENMKMPFGKHKGKQLKNLPKDYVVWCKENLQMTPDLKAGFACL